MKNPSVKLGNAGQAVLELCLEAAPDISPVGETGCEPTRLNVTFRLGYSGFLGKQHPGLPLLNSSDS